MLAIRPKEFASAAGTQWRSDARGAALATDSNGSRVRPPSRNRPVYRTTSGHAANPATALTLPPPAQPAMAALLEGMARFDIEMVGPPPQL